MDLIQIYIHYLWFWRTFMFKYLSEDSNWASQPASMIVKILANTPVAQRQQKPQKHQELTPLNNYQQIQKKTGESRFSMSCSWIMGLVASKWFALSFSRSTRVRHLKRWGRMRSEINVTMCRSTKEEANHPRFQTINSWSPPMALEPTTPAWQEIASLRSDCLISIQGLMFGRN